MIVSIFEPYRGVYILIGELRLITGLIDCSLKRLVAFVLSEERLIRTRRHGPGIKEILRGINFPVGSVN